MPGLPPIIYSLIMMAVSYALNYVIASMAEKPEQDSPEVMKENNRGHLVNTKSTEETLPLIYGKMRVGLNIIYQNVSGSDNSKLHIVGTIGEGEIQGLVSVGGVPQIWLDDKLASDPVFTTRKAVHWPDDQPVEYETRNLVSYQIFTGTANQSVCTTLQNAVGEWTDPLPYTAYIYMCLEYDKNVFQNIPEITLLVEGVKVYDPYIGGTAYSNNPALCVRDFLTRSSRRGGMGINPTRIDDNSIIEAANYCNQADRLWTIGLPIQDQAAAIDNLTQMLATFRGAVVYTGSVFSLKYKDTIYETPVMSVDEHDVVFDGENSSLIIKQPSIFDTPNGVRLKYLDEEIKYQINDYVFSPAIGSTGDLVTQDGDYREETYDIKGINSRNKAAAMSSYLLERARINKTFSHSGFARLMALEPMDLIYFSHEIPGWENKLARVQSIGLNQTGDVQVDYIEEYDTMYNNVYDLQEHSWTDTNIHSPSDPPESVSNVVIAEEIYYYRGRSFTRLKINFDPPDSTSYPFWDYAQVWVKIGDTPESGSYKFMTKSEHSYVIDPVNEGVYYSIKLLSVNIWGAVEDFEDANEYVQRIDGKTSHPSDVVGLTVVASGDTVTLIAPSINDPDIEGYEIRLGDAWIGGRLIGFGKAPMIRLAGVKPGTYSFWMAAKGNNNAYSENPAYATCTVFYPSGYVDIEDGSWAWDFSSGIHNNTQTVTYNSLNALMCSQTDNNLTGTWTSPAYDLGTRQTVRCWGDFVSVYASAGTTWNSLFPAPYPIYPPTHNATYVKSTSYYNANYYPYWATDPTKTLTGIGDNNSWLSVAGTDTNQRFHIDLGSEKVVDKIYYENMMYWTGGGSNYTIQGVKYFTLWGSNSPTAFSDLTYTHDTDWTQIVVCPWEVRADGIYHWNGTSWDSINGNTATCWAYNGDTFYSNFAGYAVYKYTVAGGWVVINPTQVANLVISGGILYGDFTSYGVYKYDDDEDHSWTYVGVTGSLPAEDDSLAYFSKHISANQADPKYIEFDNLIPYRYYAFKFVNNRGTEVAEHWMGFRRLVLQNKTTWYEKVPIITRWVEAVGVDSSAILSAKILWADSVDGNGILENPVEASYFEILAPEFTARYVQVQVTITDPFIGFHLYLRDLNVTTAYWA